MSKDKCTVIKGLNLSKEEKKWAKDNCDLVKSAIESTIKQMRSEQTNESDGTGDNIDQ